MPRLHRGEIPRRSESIAPETEAFGLRLPERLAERQVILLSEGLHLLERGRLLAGRRRACFATGDALLEGGPAWGYLPGRSRGPLGLLGALVTVVHMIVGKEYLLVENSLEVEVVAIRAAITTVARRISEVLGHQQDVGRTSCN